MRSLWIPRLAAALGALLLTAAGIALLFVAPPLPGRIWPYLLNPGALLVGWIWPEGVHSDAPLAALSSLFLVAADLAAWWLILYFGLLRPLRRLVQSRGSGCDVTSMRNAE